MPLFHELQEYIIYGIFLIIIVLSDIISWLAIKISLTQTKYSNGWRRLLVYLLSMGVIICFSQLCWKSFAPFNLFPEVRHTVFWNTYCWDVLAWCSVQIVIFIIIKKEDNFSASKDFIMFVGIGYFLAQWIHSLTIMARISTNSNAEISQFERLLIPCALAIIFWICLIANTIGLRLMHVKNKYRPI